MSLSESVLDFLWPKRCLSCHHFGAWLCPRCRESIIYFSRPICPACGEEVKKGHNHDACEPTSLSYCLALGVYEGTLKKLIEHLKFFGHFAVATEAADLLLERFPDELDEIDLLIPIPLHSSRERERGYNQSAILAKELSLRLKQPVLNLLEKQKKTRPQAGLSRTQRLGNLKGAFSLIQPSSLSGKTVALVDDVFTTGTTLGECAQLLAQAGATRVIGLVLAHGT